MQEAIEQPPQLIVLTVEEQQDRFLVTQADGPFSQSEEERIRGYSERTEEIDVIGSDFYGLRFIADRGGMATFQVWGFWTGAVRANYEEDCLLELLDDSDVVVREAGRDFVTINPIPVREELRDSTRRLGTISLVPGVALEDLSPRFTCRLESGGSRL